MSIEVLKDRLVLRNVQDFNVEHTLDCGQCFRWNKYNDGWWAGIAYGKVLALKQIDETTIEIITNEEDFKSIRYHYFDLGRDYGAIKNKLSDGGYLDRAMKYGWGIRILKQELWETTCSFIISQQNNIPRIKKLVTKISENWGETSRLQGLELYTFPNHDFLLENTKLEDLKAIGLGYRAQYVYRAAQHIDRVSYKLKNEKLGDGDFARVVLMGLHGVGPKVANCISLFSLGYTDSFPIDTWISKVIAEQSITKQYINNLGNLAGFAQQYMFYYAKNGGK